MIDRIQIESILKVNGVPVSSPDNYIRSVLLSARYSKDDADAALTVLRENKQTNQIRIDGLHKVFRSDQTLKPEEISELLGVDISVRHLTVEQEVSIANSRFPVLVVCFLSVLVALVSVLSYMYMYKIGIFHQSVVLAL
jgi:hypothetical protein